MTHEHDQDLLVGRILDGRYRIESRIGAGGMGFVYKAIQQSTYQTVAVKVIRPEYASDSIAIKRFRREARAASMLAHPHTVRLIDFGMAPAGELYMVTEYLSGRSLNDVLEVEGRLAPRRVMKIACESVQSLTEAHKAGLVHRDLKPANIMLINAFGSPDFVKIMDFGIAKFVAGSIEETGITPTGEVIGTPYFIAPEMAEAKKKITTAVDVYSLGVTMFLAISGRVPFSGSSKLQILLAHVNEPVPELPADSDIPDGLKKIVRDMLAKNPADRPTSEEIEVKLERLLGSHQVSVVEAPGDSVEIEEVKGLPIAATDRFWGHGGLASSFIRRRWRLLLLVLIGLGLALDLVLLLSL